MALGDILASLRSDEERKFGPHRRKHKREYGRDCGAGGRAVASDNSDSWFEPFHWQSFTYPVCQLNRKHKNRDEEAGVR